MPNIQLSPDLLRRVVEAASALDGAPVCMLPQGGIGLCFDEIRCTLTGDSSLVVALFKGGKRAASIESRMIIGDTLILPGITGTTPLKIFAD